MLNSGVINQKPLHEQQILRERIANSHFCKNSTIIMMTLLGSPTYRKNPVTTIANEYTSKTDIKTSPAGYNSVRFFFNLVGKILFVSYST